MTENRLERLRRLIPRPTLNPAFTAVQTDENTLHIRAGPWSGPTYTIRDEDEEGVLNDLPPLLSGEHTLEELLNEFDSEHHSEILNFLEELEAEKIIHDVRDSGTSWTRIGLRNRFSLDDEEPLASHTPLIVSIGRMGVAIAEDLLEMGIGGVRLLRPKPSESREVEELKRTNRVQVLGSDSSVAGSVERADFVIYAAERPAPEVVNEINDRAQATGTTWFNAQVQGFDGLIGPLILPGETACYSCFRQRMRANISNIDGYDAYRQKFSGEQTLAQKRIPAISRVVAGYATLDLLNVLIYGRGFLAGRVVVVSGLDLSVEVNDILKLPRCSVCSSATGGWEYHRFVDDDGFRLGRELLDDAPSDEGESGGGA